MQKSFTRLAAWAAAITIVGFGVDAALAQAAGRSVTRDRVMQRGGAQFDRLDANKDGTIDQAEYEKFIDDEMAKLKARLLKRFSGDDANADGKLTREEFIAGLEKWFQGVDANHDGRLEQREFEAARKARRLQPAGEAPKP